MKSKKGNATTPENPQRRRLLAGASALGVSSTLLPLGGAQAGQITPSAARPLTDYSAAKQTELLHKHVKNIVVIYAENRSFNNLFANFPGSQQPLHQLSEQATRQVDRDGSPLPHLPPIWKGMVPDPQVVNHKRYHIDQEAKYLTELPNKPFALQGDDQEALPQGVITRDLWHVFYQNQMQINGGKNDRFVAWADAGALTMGYYADSA
ncbi:acid phosphatase [Rosenbergiella nectarea]|uniref:phospholipase C n=2 Tax=Rosenbergiella nectarea TaxID=988801 RepID=A0A1H9LRT9_9GAMM|nr:acid phosphatase [Rosenbergiella nectarea]